MSLASVLLAALPQGLRHPAPRPSEAAAEFDRLLDTLHRSEWPVEELSQHPTDARITVAPFDAPLHAVRRRARN
jgi:hypothetical protein